VQVGDLATLPEGAVEVYHRRGRRSLIDWLTSKGVTVPCWSSGEVTLVEYSWTFFEYTQSIPIYVRSTKSAGVRWALTDHGYTRLASRWT